MPTFNLYDVIERTNSTKMGFYIITTLVSIICYFTIFSLTDFPFIWTIAFIALLVYGYKGLCLARFYHWLFMNNIDPSKLIHSFKTRHYVEDKWRLWLARVCSFGIIHKEIKAYHHRVNELDWNQPFQDTIPIKEEYNFDKIGFLNSTDNFLCLNKDGIRYDHSSNYPWQQILAIQINYYHDDYDRYFIEIKTKSGCFTLDISKIETDFIELEFILKTMHLHYTSQDLITPLLQSV